jgi:hypothetical protein
LCFSFLSWLKVRFFYFVISIAGGPRKRNVHLSLCGGAT